MMPFPLFRRNSELEKENAELREQTSFTPFRIGMTVKKEPELAAKSWPAFQTHAPRKLTLGAQAASASPEQKQLNDNSFSRHLKKLPFASASGKFTWYKGLSELRIVLNMGCLGAGVVFKPCMVIIL